MMAFNDAPDDNQALARFYEAHKDALFRLARKYLNNSEQAADALQDSIESLIRSYDRLRGFSDAQLFAYSMSVVRNQCYHIIQKSKSCTVYDPQIDTAGLEQDMAGPDPYAVALDRIALQSAVHKLQPNYRFAIEMRYYYDLDDEDIAAMLKIKAESVRTILSRARRKLKKLYLSEEVKTHG